MESDVSRDANEHDPAHTEMTERFDANAEASTLGIEARAIFGENALMAVAYCGLDAWLEGNEQESELWGRVLNRLMT
nr:conserved hypothetical protein [Rhizobiaceae bacterium]